MGSDELTSNKTVPRCQKTPVSPEAKPRWSKRVWLRRCGAWISVGDSERANLRSLQESKGVKSQRKGGNFGKKGGKKTGFRLLQQRPNSDREKEGPSQGVGETPRKVKKRNALQSRPDENRERVDRKDLRRRQTRVKTGQTGKKKKIKKSTGRAEERGQ